MQLFPSHVYVNYPHLEWKDLIRAVFAMAADRKETRQVSRNETDVRRWEMKVTLLYFLLSDSVHQFTADKVSL